MLSSVPAKALLARERLTVLQAACLPASLAARHWQWQWLRSLSSQHSNWCKVRGHCPPHRHCHFLPSEGRLCRAVPY